MTKTKTLLAALCTIAALTLTGCPTAPGTFEVWIVNTSDEITVANVKLTDNENMDNVREFSEDLGTNRSRVLSNIPLGDFDGGTITVDITGENAQIIEDVSTSVNVPDEIQSGLVLVIVVSGDNVLNFDADYVPLDDASKGELMFRNHLLGGI